MDFLTSLNTAFSPNPIVVVNGVITREDVAEHLCTIMGGEPIIFPASHDQKIHYLKIQGKTT
jgi:hypothetical protein